MKSKRSNENPSKNDKIRNAERNVIYINFACKNTITTNKTLQIGYNLTPYDVESFQSQLNPLDF